jgi:hypothetical protein
MTSDWGNCSRLSRRDYASRERRCSLHASGCRGDPDRSRHRPRLSQPALSSLAATHRVDRDGGDGGGRDCLDRDSLNSATASELRTKRSMVASSASANITSRSGKLRTCSFVATFNRAATVWNTGIPPSRSQTSHQAGRPGSGKAWPSSVNSDRAAPIRISSIRAARA